MDCIVHAVELNMSGRLSLFSLFCVGLEQTHWLFTLKPVGFWNGTYTISSLGSQSFGLRWKRYILDLQLANCRLRLLSHHNSMSQFLTVSFLLSIYIYAWLFVTLWTVTYQASWSMGILHWSGLPCPPPGGLPSLGIEPVSLMSPALAHRFFTTSIYTLLVLFLWRMLTNTMSSLSIYFFNINLFILIGG